MNNYIGKSVYVKINGEIRRGTIKGIKQLSFLMVDVVMDDEPGMTYSVFADVVFVADDVQDAKIQSIRKQIDSFTKKVEELKTQEKQLLVPVLENSVLSLEKNA